MMIKQFLEYNASRWFILKPIVDEDEGELSEHRLLNSYLKDRNREDIIGDHLFVLFKPPDFDYFELFLHHQKQNPNYVEDYDYEGGFVVVVYKIPHTLLADFELFKNGRYSKMSKALKRLYPEKMTKQGRTVELNIGEFTFKKTFQNYIFTKDKDFKEALERELNIKFDQLYDNPDDIELWEGYNEKKETLVIEEIIQQHGEKSKLTATASVKKAR